MCVCVSSPHSRSFQLNPFFQSSKHRREIINELYRGRLPEGGREGGKEGGRDGGKERREGGEGLKEDV